MYRVGENMIELIEININNPFNNDLITIDYYNKKVTINNQSYNVKLGYLNYIIHTLTYWKNEYGTKKGIDIEEFTIKVYDSNKKITTFHGKGVYPSNYQEFKTIIKEPNYE